MRTHFVVPFTVLEEVWYTMQWNTLQNTVKYIANYPGGRVLGAGARRAPGFSWGNGSLAPCVRAGFAGVCVRPCAFPSQATGIRTGLRLEQTKLETSKSC